MASVPVPKYAIGDQVVFKVPAFGTIASIYNTDGQYRYFINVEGGGQASRNESDIDLVVDLDGGRRRQATRRSRRAIKRSRTATKRSRKATKQTC